LTNAGGVVNDVYVSGTGPGSVVELCLSGEPGRMPDVVGTPFREAMRLLAPTGVKVNVSGEGGDVVAQSPAPGRPITGEVRLELGYLETGLPEGGGKQEETEAAG
jgi:hypothetical protein